MDNIKPLCELIAAKYKVRALNLSNNGITDQGAQDLFNAIQNNPYLIKFKMELNPTRT
jgi:Ran GTPase-activating protein (RanGAP) involved in mRNA processing and transport